MHRPNLPPAHPQSYPDPAAPGSALPVQERARRGTGLVGDGVACQHPGDLVHTLGDTHLYLNHLEQAELQLSRAPRPLPTLSLEGAPRDLFAIGAEHIVISGYDPHPTIKAPVAV